MPVSRVKPPFFPYGPTTPLEYLGKEGKLLSQRAPLRPSYSPSSSEVEAKRGTWHLSVPDPRDSATPKAARKPTFLGARGENRELNRELWDEGGGASRPPLKRCKMYQRVPRGLLGLLPPNNWRLFQSKGLGEVWAERERKRYLSPAGYSHP